MALLDDRERGEELVFVKQNTKQFETHVHQVRLFSSWTGSVHGILRNDIKRYTTNEVHDFVTLDHGNPEHFLRRIKAHMKSDDVSPRTVAEIKTRWEALAARALHEVEAGTVAARAERPAQPNRRGGPASFLATKTA